jgi:hypothetical protein
MTRDCLSPPLEGAWADLKDEKPLLVPGDMAARINVESKVQGFPEVAQPHELVSVVFRSLAKRYGEVFDGIQRCTGEPLERLCIVGGGVRNEVLNRLAQEVTGLELLRGASEATLIGNAAVQIATLENIRSLEDIQSIASRLSFGDEGSAIPLGIWQPCAAHALPAFAVYNDSLGKGAGENRSLSHFADLNEGYT